jgi:pathogenesis-related protein 1
MKITKVLFLLVVVTFPAISSGSLTESELQEMVNVHNKWRSEVNVAPVTWSSSLATTAQTYADTLRDKQHCQMVHSHTKDVGENLFWASPVSYSNGTSALQPMSSIQVVNEWGAEKNKLQLQHL